MKKKLKLEFYRFLFYFLFLFIFLSAFIVYKRILLREYDIIYTHYGFALIESLFLAKIIMIGEIFGLKKQSSMRPLILQIIYNTFIFSLFILAFAILEHIIVGFYHGLTMIQIYSELIHKRIYEILSNLFIMFFVLIPFFSILEIANIIGPQKFIDLLFRNPRVKH